MGWFIAIAIAEFLEGTLFNFANPSSGLVKETTNFFERWVWPPVGPGELPNESLLLWSEPAPPFWRFIWSRV